MQYFPQQSLYMNHIKTAMKVLLCSQILYPIGLVLAAALSHAPATSTSTRRNAAFVVSSKSMHTACRSTRHFRQSVNVLPLSTRLMLYDDVLSTSASLSSSSLVTSAVEIFDGSTIIDPVVVSNIFWATLKAKLIWLVIGQVISVAIFAIVASVAASQMSTILENITGAFPLLDVNKNRQQRPYKRLEVPPDLRGTQPDWTKLAVCIAVDLIGSSSEVIPLVGELSDILYAPIAATILRSLYGSNIVFALEFVEEILPFTDILPLATICWVVDTFASDSDLAKLLKIGQYGPMINGMGSDDSIIDVKATEEIPKRLLRNQNGDDAAK
jgi:hypothetical protein